MPDYKAFYPVESTPRTETDPAKLWRWYIQLTQDEAAFRTAKSDLKLRPIDDLPGVKNVVQKNQGPRTPAPTTAAKTEGGTAELGLAP